MKVGIGIGVTMILIGLSLMITGRQMCRTSCWADDMLKLILPKSLEFLAGGLPWVLIGLALIVHAIWSSSRR